MSSDLVRSGMRTRGSSTCNCAYCDTSVVIRHSPFPLFASTLHTPSGQRERETDRIPSFLHSHFFVRPLSFSLPIRLSLIFFIGMSNSLFQTHSHAHTQSWIQLVLDGGEARTHSERHRDTSRRERKDRQRGNCPGVKKGESDKEQ